MTLHNDAVVVSTPGRVCLFGEHQDYLQLPVIPCAISLRTGITARYREDMHVEIDLPDIGSHEAFSLTGPLTYVVERDYFRSAVNVLRRSGYSFSRGLECTVHGTIPLNAGTSSSSALIVSWVGLLALVSDQRARLSGEACARYAHEAEVLEFGEPGGMMDHYATACGGVMSIDFQPDLHVERLNCPLKTFVLGNSGEPKDTKGILARVKNGVLEAVGVLRRGDPQFSLATATLAAILRRGGDLARDQIALLEGTLRNRDITEEARRVMRSPVLDHRRLGQLLTEHQSVLRDALKISTPKIDRMLDAALGNGAYGGKINGSGGGGCMFAYAPEQPERVAEAIERAGGQAFIVAADEGMRVESDQRR
jgi:galactokinase